MYAVKPFYTDSVELSLPDNMYKAKNLYAQKESLPSEESDPLAALERKQNEIFSRLYGLKDMVNQLSMKYKTDTPPSSRVMTSTTAQGNMTSTPTKGDNQSSVPLLSQQKIDLGDVIHDLVISADPDNPPLSLFVLFRIASEKFKVFASSFVHSSIINMPSNLKEVFKNGGSTNRDGNEIALTLVWKKVENGPTLMVNPHKQTTIEGESNIARYIQRLLNPDFDKCVVSATRIDEWLDLAEQYIRGNKKENAAVLKSLNSRLGSAEWLVGESVSLADIVMWSVISQSKTQKDSPANVKNWLQRCEKNVYFDIARSVV